MTFLSAWAAVRTAASRLEADLHEPGIANTDVAGCTTRKVDHAPVCKWAAVGDAHDHRALILKVGHAHQSAEGESLVSGYGVIWVKAIAAGHLSPSELTTVPRCGTHLFTAGWFGPMPNCTEGLSVL